MTAGYIDNRRLREAVDNEARRCWRWMHQRRKKAAAEDKQGGGAMAEFWKHSAGETETVLRTLLSLRAEARVKETAWR